MTPCEWMQHKSPFCRWMQQRKAQTKRMIFAIIISLLLIISSITTIITHKHNLSLSIKPYTTHAHSTASL